MDVYKNVCITPDEHAAEIDMGSPMTVTGGTSNSMPGSSIADQTKEVLHGGSAAGALAMDVFKNTPMSPPDFMA